MRRRVAISTLGLLVAVSLPAWANAPTPLPNGGTVLNVPVKSLVELRFTNVVKQAYDVSCGAAALATILKYYYGEPVTERMVIDAMLTLGDKEKIQRDGFSLLEMKRFAEQQGYLAVGYRINDVDKLRKLQIPYIALVNLRGYAHFVVIKGVAGDEVFIADPAFGNRSRPFGAFVQEWNGVILVIVSPARQGNSAFTMDPTLKAPVSQVIPIIQRILGGVRPAFGDF